MGESVEDTRERLLEAAGEVFAEKGFQAATVREICGRAGANVASVNYHFGCKDRLYVETVRRAHCSGSPGPEADWPPGTPPAEKLRSFVRQMLERVLDRSRPPWHVQLMMREMSDPTEACRELVEANIRPRTAVLHRIIDELVPPETCRSDRHLIAFSIVGQCLFYSGGNHLAELLVGEEEFRTYDPGRLADHITTFSLAAMGHGVATT